MKKIIALLPVAASLFVIIPIIIPTMSIGKNLTRGLTARGVKG